MTVAAGMALLAVGAAGPQVRGGVATVRRDGRDEHRDLRARARRFIGWRYLDEGSVRRRTIAAAIILGGLVLLVISG